MERTVTVSVRGLLVTGLALLALLTAYLLGGAGGSPASTPRADAAPVGVATTTAEPGDAPRTLRMVGTGEATVVPDQLGFALSVTAAEPELSDAMARSTATLRRVLAALREEGVREADVQTTGLQMHPEYDYPAYGPAVLTGYRVTQKARVVVRELTDGGEAVSAAVATGGNAVRVNDIRLTVSDPESAMGRARTQAVEAATAKAEQYAAATGQELGSVLDLREMGADAPRRSPVMWQSAARDSSVEGLAALPVRAGKDDLTVRVEVVWAFE